MMSLRVFVVVLVCLIGVSGLLIGLRAILVGPSNGMSYFFRPIKEHISDPKNAGLDYRDVYFEAADGTRLHGWFVPAKNERLGSVLFLHGNSENISTHFERVAWLPEGGFDTLFIDYRGYGRSEGEPALDGLHQDVAAGLDTLLAMPGVLPENVIVFGQSLGGAIALTAIADSPFKDRLAGLVIEGAFSDYRRIARETMSELWYAWPFQWLISLAIDGRFEPLTAASALSPLPLLIVHGQADEEIGPHHGEALFEAASEPKMIWRPEEAGHVVAFATPAMQQRLIDHIAALVKAQEKSSDKLAGSPGS